MDRGERSFFAIALIVTLIGSFALCAKAYQRMRSEPPDPHEMIAHVRPVGNLRHSVISSCRP